MSTVAFTLLMTGDEGQPASPSFPAGTVCAGIRCTLTGAASMAPVVLSVGEKAGSFVDVPLGDYTFTAVAVDASGNALGASFSGPVVVAEPVPAPAPAEVTIAVPVGFSYTVS